MQSANWFCIEKLLEFTKSQGIELAESTVKEFSGLMQKEVVSASAPSFEVMNELGRLLDLPEGNVQVKSWHELNYCLIRGICFDICRREED